TGVEGKMFEPMALTVMIALIGAFILSLTFVPAMIAILVTGRFQEQENAAICRLKTLYRPILRAAIEFPLPVLLVATVLLVAARALFTQLGQAFIPTLQHVPVIVAHSLHA